MVAKTPETSVLGVACLDQWHFFVSCYESWMDGVSAEAPDVQFIEAMQRRRLSPLAKASLSVMHRCVQGVFECQVIYASRHGELARTTELLNQMAAGDMVSPMGFSLAVLNATAGLYSIAVGSRAACSAVSAGARTFEMGLLEATMQAHSSGLPVLYVYADAPIPDVYGTGHSVPLHAMAMLVHGQPAENRIEVRCTCSNVLSKVRGLPQSLLFEHAWSSRHDKNWTCEGRLLNWGF